MSAGDLCLGVCLTGISACLKLLVVIGLLINCYSLFSPSELPLKISQLWMTQSSKETFSCRGISLWLCLVLQVLHRHLCLYPLYTELHCSSRELSQCITIKQIKLNDFVAIYLENLLAQELINKFNLPCLKKLYLCLLILKWIVYWDKAMRFWMKTFPRGKGKLQADFANKMLSCTSEMQLGVGLT